MKQTALLRGLPDRLLFVCPPEPGGCISSDRHASWHFRARLLDAVGSRVAELIARPEVLGAVPIDVERIQACAPLSSHKGNNVPSITAVNLDPSSINQKIAVEKDVVLAAGAAGAKRASKATTT